MPRPAKFCDPRYINFEKDAPMIHAVETVILVVLVVFSCPLSTALGAEPARAVPLTASSGAAAAPAKTSGEDDNPVPVSPLTVKESDSGAAESAEPSAEQHSQSESKDNTPDSGRPEAILKEIIRGISEGDYAMYTRNFSDQLKVTQKREDFLQLQRDIQKKLGIPKSVGYLGFYVQEGSKIILFKARFGRHKDDVLIRLVMDKDAANPKVTGLWFDSPALEK